VDAPVVEADDRDIGLGLTVGEGELAPRALLAAAVGHVVGMAVEEQVVGIDAAPLVAAVADVHARRDRPVAQAPGEAVGPLRPTGDAESAVAAVAAGALPEVAAGDRIDPGVVGESPLEGPARAAMNARLLHAAHFKRCAVNHLLWAMAFAIPWETAGVFAGPLPITISANRLPVDLSGNQPRRPDRSLAKRGVVEGPFFLRFTADRSEKVPPLRAFGAPVGTTGDSRE